MKIAAVLNVHDDPNLVIDTLESIQTYMTKDVLVVIDGSSKVFRNVSLPAKSMMGFVHGYRKAPYRNVALGLKSLAASDADWVCYLEPDCLVASERFKRNLEIADERGVWMLGNDGRVEEKNLSFVAPLVGSEFRSVYYLLGACQFFSRKFIDKLLEINFFERFLSLTNGFSDGFVPFYSGYDFSEHLYPTLARHFGGNIGVFATYENGKWHGKHDIFPVRWRPELEDIYENASILHPIKDYFSPVRQYYREKRNCQKL